MEQTKRQDLPAEPGLWVVATPIGNLEDLTARARQALAHADEVLCEDTRRTAQLLAALRLQPRTSRLDAHATPAQIARVVQAMQTGKTYALVTDAGTPGVSDPAAELVRAAHAEGVRVTPIPGPSAVTALLSVAGLAGSGFTFRGYFPRKNGERVEELETFMARAEREIWVWFESPERLQSTMEAIAHRLPYASLVAGKELTKFHEKIFADTAARATDAISEELKNEGNLGEWCFALQLPRDFGDRKLESSDWVKALQCLLDVPLPASDAARRISQAFGVAKKQVYEVALRLSGKKTEEGG